MSSKAEGQADSPRYSGSSRAGFSAAALDAVQRAEEEQGELARELRVVELSVEVEGPIGDYRVVLSP
jgi:flavin-binding protein dodecin